jgi:hypothetical protein
MHFDQLPSYSRSSRDRAIGERHHPWNARRQEDAKGDAAAQLAALEMAWNTTHLGNDAAALDRLWADDIVIFVPRMRPMSKPEALGDVQGRRRDVHPRRDVRRLPACHRRPGGRDRTAAADAQRQRARGVGGLAVHEGLPARRLRMAPPLRIPTA